MEIEQHVPGRERGVGIMRHYQSVLNVSKYKRRERQQWTSPIIYYSVVPSRWLLASHGLTENWIKGKYRIYNYPFLSRDHFLPRR